MVALVLHCRPVAFAAPPTPEAEAEAMEVMISNKENVCAGGGAEEI